MRSLGYLTREPPYLNREIGSHRYRITYHSLEESFDTTDSYLGTGPAYESCHRGVK